MTDQRPPREPWLTRPRVIGGVLGVALLVIANFDFGDAASAWSLIIVFGGIGIVGGVVSYVRRRR